MPSTNHPRAISTPIVILAGIAAFAIALLITLSRTPAPGAHAQDSCSQPSDGGCPMELNGSVSAALTDPTAVHNWLLRVPVNNDFTVVLTQLSGDYRLSVWGPDGTLIGSSNFGGTEDEIVLVTNTGTGSYRIVVDSPSGDASSDPYLLLATATGEVVPFDPYGAVPPPAVTFSPY
jgi:hypothetical protein